MTSTGLSSPSRMGLKAFVVGAGIAGLSASIALRKAGHEVTIFERSTFKSEIGAAITITPNGSRILDTWGFDSKRAGAVETQRMQLVNGATMEPIHEEPFSRLESRYGYGLKHYHRVDLHRELQDTAQSLGVRIELGSPVDEVNTNGEIKVGGSCLTADLVVIADGVHSQHISTVTGKEEPLIYFGRSSIRALIPQDKIRSDPEVAKFFGQQEPCFYIPCTMPPDPTQMIAYPCRENSMLNVALVHTTLSGYENRKDWHSPISLEDALRTIPTFHSTCRQVITMADSLKIYALTVREALPNFVNGRLVLVGDAAHVMPPIHVQGAVTGIEEACALGVFLHDLQDPSQVPERLKLYEDLVKPRMQTTQLLSQAMPGQNSTYRKQAEHIWEASGRGKLYPDTAVYLSPDIADFFYTFDMHSEAKKAMQEAGRAG